MDPPIVLKNVSHSAPPLAPAPTSPLIYTPADSEAAIEEQSPADFPDGGWKAWSVVVGSFCGLFVHFGFVNAVGAVQTYVSNNQLAGENVSSVSWVFSIYMWLPLFLGALIGPVFDRHGATWLLAASTSLLFIGFVALSFSGSIVAFIFSLSVCLGIAHALAIPPLISLIGHWFLLHRGAAIGIALLGGSAGGAVWPLVLQKFYDSVGFPWAIRICGAMCVTLLAISVFLVRLRVEMIPKSGPNRLANPPGKSFKTFSEFLNLRPFKDSRFTLLVIGVLFTEIALMSILAYLASFALVHGFSEQRSLVLLTILNTMGVPSRFLAGIISDRIGSLNTMLLMLIGFTFSIFVVWLPFNESKKGLYAFTVLCGFFSSSILSLTPVCLASFTPVDIFGRCYGLMYTFSSTGILFGVPVGSAIIGSSTSESWRNFTIFCGCFAFTGTCFWMGCRYLIVGFKLNRRA